MGELLMSRIVFTVLIILLSGFSLKYVWTKPVSIMAAYEKVFGRYFGSDKSSGNNVSNPSEAPSSRSEISTELRPYLTIELKPGVREYLQKDGNSRLFVIGRHKNDYIILPFKTRNVGKVHAAGIVAQYSSSSQQNENIEIGEKSSFLAAGEEIPETFRPWINIQDLDSKKNKEFEVILRMTYKEYVGDSKMYFSELRLNIKEEMKENQKIYAIQKNEFATGLELERKDSGAAVKSMEKKVEAGG